MTTSVEVWKMLAGIAFFLLAMNFMENTLRQLAGRRFKLFLKQQTTNKIKAIGGGAIVTGLLQSSSIVNLLVLNMVGAGVVKMENALALMLGSNLGTTLNSWIIVSLGFNYNIENVVLPVVAIAGILMAFINNENRWYAVFKFLFSLAFLFVALGYIKDGMEGFVKQTDLSFFKEYPVIVFVLLGIVLTTIVQSSSATIALSLSALSANAITLYMATGIALGSEIGTTFKLFLASADGVPVKKRVALGNFLFNIVTVIVILFLLQPVNYFITEILLINNNLIALVFFQSFVNGCSVLLFFPFLNVMGKFLTSRFANNKDESFYISKVSVADIDMALEALESETRHLITQVINYSLESFELADTVWGKFAGHEKIFSKPGIEKYNYIKLLHGQMHGFYLKLQKQPLDETASKRLGQLIAAIRNSMYAAKSISDAQQDIRQMQNSGNEIKYNFYRQSREKVSAFYEHILPLLLAAEKPGSFDELNGMYRSITTGYPETLGILYKENLTSRVSEMEISTLINFNRELYTSFKSVLFALKDFLLTFNEAEYFDSQPGFIR